MSAHRILAAGIACLLLTAANLRAQTWDAGGAAGGSLLWSAGTNWDTNVAPVNNGTATVVFGGTLDLAPDMDANWSINSLAFNNTAGAFTLGSVGGFTLTIGSGGIVNNDTQLQTINNAIALGASHTWSATSGALVVGGAVALGSNTLTFNAASGTSTVTGQVSGTGGLTKNGTATLTIGGNGDNAYTGATTVNAGTLNLNKTVGTATTGPLIIGDGAGSDTVTLLASNQISNAGAVTVNDSGVFNVGGFTEAILTLTINGGSTDIGTGTLNLGTSLILTAGNVSSSGAGQLVLTGLLTTNAAATSATISGNVNLGASIRSFTIAEGAAANDLDLTAVVSNGGINKLGTGTLRLEGNNTFALGQNVTQGTIFVASNTAAGTGTIALSGGTISSDATFTLANALTINGNSTANDITLAGAATLVGNRTLTVSFGTAVLGGAIGGDVTTNTFTKAGSGVLLFNGTTANTYTGVTTVSDGTLAMGKSPSVTAIAGDLVIGSGAGVDTVFHVSSNQIADTSTVTINSSGQLFLGTQSDAIASLVLAGGAASTSTGTLTLLGNITTNASTTGAIVNGNLNLGGPNRTISVADGTVFLDLDVSAVVTNGGITKTGDGLLRLSGSTPNALVSTSVNEGTLLLSKTVANGAINGDLVIGSGTGTDIVQLGASDQIADGTSPIINTTGQLLLNGFNETIGGLTMTGGLVSTGSGKLTLGGNVVTNPSVLVATISGNLSLGGGTRTFNVVDGIAATDLDITAVASNGGVIKNGSGTLAISGVFSTGVTLDDGALIGNIVIQSDSSFTQNGGDFSGTVTNQGGFLPNAGNFNGSLINQANVDLSKTFTAGGGIENSGTLSVFSGVTLTANGTGFVNVGALTVINGTLAGTSVKNDFGGQMTARGTVNTVFTNNGALDLTGLLTLGAASSNAGIVTIASTESLRANAAFSNTGQILLSGGAISGTGTVTNDAGGVIEGRGAVAAAMGSNSGLVHASGLLTLSNLAANAASGELRIDAGQQLNVTSGFTNSGLISLRGADAMLGGGTISNTGLIEGRGRITNVMFNLGVIRSSGTLVLAGPVSGNGVPVSNSIRYEVPIGTEILATGGILSNVGVIAIDGGRFEVGSTSMTNLGIITGHGILATPALFNFGAVTLTGGNTTIHGDVTNSATKLFRVDGGSALFTGNFVNNGTFKNTDAKVTFAGTYTENGTFISDPADNYFTDLHIGPTGALVGGLGDRFIIGNSLNGASTQSSLWETSAAELRFAGSATHSLSVFADDLGASYRGYEENFSWGILSLGGGESLVLDESSAPGGVIYTGVLSLTGGLAQINSITGPGTIYYDQYDDANDYLDGGTYSLSGGGTITPIVVDLRITSITRNSSGHITLACVGAPGRTNRIEAVTSLNQKPVPWATVATIPAAEDGTFSFTDTSAPAFQTRLYRIAYP